MVSPAAACSTPDIVGIIVFADFWFLIRGFSGIISFTLQLFNSKFLCGRVGFIRRNVT